jgi:hypothetical protein
VKLRLAKMRPGRREGVESEIHRDLTTLARNKAISDALVVSAEEDLAQVIGDVQDMGVRVLMAHITVDGNWTISRSVRQECDDIVEVNAAHLRPYVELIAGAEPSADEQPESAAPLAQVRPLSNGHVATGYPAASGQQPAAYTAPAVTEYQRPVPAPQLTGTSRSRGADVAASQSSDGAGRGDTAGARDVAGGRDAAGGQTRDGQQPGDRQDVPALPLRAEAAPSARLEARQDAVVRDLRGRQDLTGVAGLAGMAGMPGRSDLQVAQDRGAQQSDVPSRPDVAARADVADRPDLAGRPELSGRQDYPLRQDSGAQPRRDAAGQPVQEPSARDLYAAPVAERAALRSNGAHPGYGESSYADSYPDQSAPSFTAATPSFTPGGRQEPDAMSAAGLEQAPTSAPGGVFHGQQQGQPKQQAFGHQQGPGQSLAQQQFGAQGGAVQQPAAISLGEAVQAAHEEGQDFGASVARDAPALWLEAVLARKPRMPSDLEARLLQGSALPIDFLLHDEVRHALRRGFWDALEQARR